MAEEPETMVAAAGRLGLVGPVPIVAAPSVAPVPPRDTAGAHLPRQGLPAVTAAVPHAVADIAPDHTDTVFVRPLRDEATARGRRASAVADEATEDIAGLRHEVYAVLAEKRYGPNHFRCSRLSIGVEPIGRRGRGVEPGPRFGPESRSRGKCECPRQECSPMGRGTLALPAQAFRARTSRAELHQRFYFWREYQVYSRQKPKFAALISCRLSG